MNARVAAGLVLAAAPARADVRDDVARRFAPVIYQEVDTSALPEADLCAAFDFDGNLGRRRQPREHALLG